MNLSFKHISLGLLLSLSAQASFAQIIVQDSRGEQTLENTPKKVVALNWDLAEQVLELGVTPVGVPNIKDYHEWVVQPQIPESVVDLGTRAEPNLSEIAKLKPDVILAANPQKDLIAKLETIAPVLYYQSYSPNQNHAQEAITNFKNIAQLLDKTDVAEQKLAQMQTRFGELKAQLTKAYGDELPSVVAMRFASESAVWLYTKNSTTTYALEQIGLTPALTPAEQEWGISQQPIQSLKDLTDAYVVYFGPLDSKDKLEKSMLWNAMPFVRQKHANEADAVWNYGGAMSIQYIAESVTKSLLELKSQE
ncbi:MAG: ABC transporter substrate-binding protein [Vibrio sp.]